MTDPPLVLFGPVTALERSLQKPAFVWADPQGPAVQPEQLGKKRNKRLPGREAGVPVSIWRRVLLYREKSSEPTRKIFKPTSSSAKLWVAEQNTEISCVFTRQQGTIQK